MSFSEPTAGRKKFYRVNVSGWKRMISKIAVVGDSNTLQGSSDLTHLSARGFYVWARDFGGARWELAADPVERRFCFAVAGRPSFEISAMVLDRVIAAHPDVCLLAYGINDAAQLRPVETYRTQIIADWAALRAAGIEPVAMTVLPIKTDALLDHSARQARVGELNAVVRQESAAHHVILCDWTSIMEAVPGSNNGVGRDSYYLPDDDFHPDPYACSMLGRALHETLAQHFRFGLDPWANTHWITPNVALEGSKGQPSSGGWNLYPPAGATVNSKTLIPSPEGNWWEIAFTEAATPANFYISSFGANLGGIPAGSTVEAVMEVQVMSGSVSGISLQVGSALATDMNVAGPAGAQILPSDGIVVLRTPPVVVPANVAIASPTVGFLSNAPSTTVRIRRCGVRKVASPIFVRPLAGLPGAFRNF